MLGLRRSSVGRQGLSRVWYGQWSWAWLSLNDFGSLEASAVLALLGADARQIERLDSAHK